VDDGARLGSLNPGPSVTAEDAENAEGEPVISPRFVEPYTGPPVNTTEKADIYMKFVWSVMLLVAAISSSTVAETARPFMATGIKICEVEADRAIIWTRLTSEANSVSDIHPRPDVFYAHPETGGLIPRRGRPSLTPIVIWPDGYDINTIAGAAPGIDGDVRVNYRPTASEGVWARSEWMSVNVDEDFTRQIAITGLTPGTEYALRVESRRGDLPGRMIEGQFRTAPAKADPARVTFTVVTGQGNNGMETSRGFRIYRQMRRLDPDFFVNTGDILYYDSLAKTLPLARWHWQRVFGFRNHREFHAEVPSYFIKDDHDTWMNDSWPGQDTKFMGDFTFEQGLAVFREQVGMGELTYRTVRWGKDLQIWMVEGRDFRSPNRAPDGPEKTIWGAEQKAWFFETVKASDATFKVLMSPTPVVGPDRDRKSDNHSNAVFAAEGNEIRKFMASQKNMVVVTGDRHWQYVSVDDETGLREYSCGPASDNHANGWSQDDVRPEHRYLNVVGGFMAGVVERVEGKATLTFTHYGVDGKVLNEDVVKAKN
jgi:alkaline phosphatase D